ncbi:MAG: AraC family transcriptional regulator [Myxococcota bacterium]
MQKPPSPIAESPSHSHWLVVYRYSSRRDDQHPSFGGAYVTHTEHVLGFVAQGRARMDFGEPVVIEAGSLFIVPAGVPHRALYKPSGEVWAVGFCATCLELDEQQPLMATFAWVRRGAVPVVPILKARQRRILRLYSDLQQELQRSVPEAPLLARAQLYLLLGELARARPNVQTVNPVNSLTSAALSYVREHALETISLADVARAVGRSAAHVAATIKRDTGHTVGTWITSARIAQATALLLHTDASLDEIIERTGWNDKTHFIRQFKKAHGKTPAAWRRDQRSHR